MTLEEIKQIISNARTGVYDSSYKIEAKNDSNLELKSINNSISINIICIYTEGFVYTPYTNWLGITRTKGEYKKVWEIHYWINNKFISNIECSKEDYDNIKSFITELYYQQQEIVEINAKAAFLV